MFVNRQDAGSQLAEKLISYKKQNPLIISLPRGGVVVGFPIATVLKIPLEVVIVRKLGSPQNPELGIGAVAEDHVVFWDTDMLEILQISNQDLLPLCEKESAELERRRLLYRKGKPLPLLTNKTIILVDDGVATGVTTHAALLSIKKHHPKKIIFAAPVCSHETVMEIQQMVDKVICLETPERMESIGRYYENFDQVTDDEVVTFLKKAKSSSISETKEYDFSHKIVW